ncbi:MAG: AIPR family protein [bacterium]
MAKNDLILLDALLEKKKPEYPELTNISEVFELFAFENLLKDHDVSYDEIEQGWVDGSDDGGIDGFYVFLDGLALSEVPTEDMVRKHPSVEVIIITCKHETTFRQVPLNNLFASLPELFDLSRKPDSFSSEYNDDLIEQRQLFCDAYRELSARQPSLHFTFIYVSRGDANSIADNVIGRARLIEEQVHELFSDCVTHFQFIGATELLNLSRKQRVRTLRLTFIENYVSRAKTNYIILTTLPDYHKFITDDQGALRTYLFESNVRDYLGTVPVNEDIEQTLANANRIDQCDFWWLNNGVTIIATAANVAGKEISLENIQIVNGLQTTETIYRRFISHPNDNDDRAVLVKIIVTQNPEVRDRIIKATNYQTGVELSSLRATEKIQRDIEEILIRDNWFYDRRKNYHKNQGRPTHRIISPSYLASCIMALVLKNPARAAKMKTKFMRIDKEYNLLFDTHMDIRIYLAVLNIVKHMEHSLVTKRIAWSQSKKFATDYRCLFAFIWVSIVSGTPDYFRDVLIGISHKTITNAELDRIWTIINIEQSKGNFKPKRLYRNQVFVDTLKNALKSGIA